MKKFWSIFTVALVALSAVSCSNNFEEEVVLGGESLSFNVNIDNTRTALEQQGENSWNTVWVGGETLVVSDGTNSYSFKNADENKNKFTCTAEGVRSLIGKAVNVVYNNVINSAAGAAGMNLTGSSDNFSNEDVILKAGNAFLKFTSTADVTFRATAEIFGNGEKSLSIVTIKAGTDVLVPIYAAENVTLSVAGVPAKSKELTFVNNKIYNLGTIAAPVESKVWGTAGTHNKWTAGTPSPMYEKGDYFIAYNLAGDTKLKFVKIGAGGDGWEGAVGGNENGVSEANKWHSCGSSDITLPATGTYDVYYYPKYSKYNIVPAGATPEEYVAPTVQYKVYMYQMNNSWANTYLYSWGSGNYTGGWPGSTTSTTETINGYTYKVWQMPVTATNQQIMVIFNNGSGTQTADSGPYTLDKDLYLLLRGTAVSVIEDPNNPEPKTEPEKIVIYLKPNSNWMQANARFAAYIWRNGSGNTWVDMTGPDKDGTYELTVPENYTYGDNIIFCRMNPSATANDWSNKWTQTRDEKIPADGKNLYTINSGSWDTGTWSVK